VHLVARAKEGFSLSDILRDFKKFTTTQIIKSLYEEPESQREWLLEKFKSAGAANGKNRIYQIWGNDNHPVFLIQPDIISQKINYVHQNLVEEGLVEKIENDPYCSARDYFNDNGLVEVTVIEFSALGRNKF